MSQRLGSRTATEDDSPEHEPDDEMSSGEGISVRRLVQLRRAQPEHEALSHTSHGDSSAAPRAIISSGAACGSGRITAWTAIKSAHRGNRAPPPDSSTK